jgi:hypothetical protein
VAPFGVNADDQLIAQWAPEGPPAGGSLDGLVVMLSPAALEVDRRQSVLDCFSGGWAQRTAPLLIQELDQRPPGFGGTEILSFRGRRMVCLPATVRTGSLSYPGHARNARGHVDRRDRVLAVPEPSQLASWRARQRI